MTSAAPLESVRRLLADGSSDTSPEDRLAMFFLALYSGAYLLLVLIAAFLKGGIVEHEETDIFVLGWVLAPAVWLGSILISLWILRRFRNARPTPLRILLGLDSLLFLLLTTAFNLLWHSRPPSADFAILVWAAVALIPIVNAAALLIAGSKPWLGPLASGWFLPIVGAVGFLNYVGFIPYYSLHYWTPLADLAVALVVGCGALLIRWPERFRLPGPAAVLAIDAIVILITVLACFDPSLHILPDHQNFYLGPANRVLHGGTMLVDTFSQYGVLVIYSLGLLFGVARWPFSYQGLSLAVAILIMIQFVILYLVLIDLFRSRLHSILLLLVTLLIGVFGTLGIIQTYPSAGPMRFGLPYLLLLVVFLRGRFPRLRRAGTILELLLVAVASLWSFETFIYTVFPYVGICVYESVASSRSPGRIVRNLATRLGWLGLVLATSQAGFAAATALRAHAWPDWTVYLGLVRTYSAVGFGTILIDPWSPWVFPIAIYFGSLTVFLYRFFFGRPFQSLPAGEFIFGLTLCGIAEYTYYLGRSHPNNLYHISGPPIIIAGYWLIWTMRRDDLPSLLRRAARFSYFAAATLALVGVFPAFVAKYLGGATGLQLAEQVGAAIRQGDGLAGIWASESALLRAGSGDPQVPEAIGLLDKYLPGQERVTVILSTANTTEILMTSGRIEEMPINDLVADSISPPIRQAILQSRPVASGQDIVLIAQDAQSYGTQAFNQLQLKILGQLCRQFSFDEVATTPHGVAAIRIRPHDGTPSPYCDTIEALLR